MNRYEETQLQNRVDALERRVAAQQQELQAVIEAVGDLVPPQKRCRRVRTEYDLRGDVLGDRLEDPQRKAIWRDVRGVSSSLGGLGGLSLQQHEQLMNNGLSAYLYDDKLPPASAVYTIAEIVGVLFVFEHWEFYEHPFRQPDVRTPCAPNLAAAQRARLVE